MTLFVLDRSRLLGFDQRPSGVPAAKVGDKVKPPPGNT